MEDERKKQMTINIFSSSLEAFKIDKAGVVLDFISQLFFKFTDGENFLVFSLLYSIVSPNNLPAT